jgi:hypothetical protein
LLNSPLISIKRLWAGVEMSVESLETDQAHEKHLSTVISSLFEVSKK